MLKLIYKNSDYSKILENYLGSGLTIDFDDWIYIGYYKQVSAIYFDFKKHPTHSGLFQGEYYNGSSWVSLNANDETFNFASSGFITWNKPADWKDSVIQGNNLYFIRIKSSEELNNFKIHGINMVFSNDIDLIESYPDIKSYTPEGSESFIAYHQEARNFILTYLKNKGKTVYSKNKYKMLDQFDLHDFTEVRQASKYLALANIFYNESDALDDKWKQKADGFFQKYSQAINLNFLSIDENDDGIAQVTESNSVQYITISRL